MLFPGLYFSLLFSVVPFSKYLLGAREAHKKVSYNELAQWAALLQRPGSNPSLGSGYRAHLYFLVFLTELYLFSFIPPWFYKRKLLQFFQILYVKIQLFLIIHL